MKIGDDYQGGEKNCASLFLMSALSINGLTGVAVVEQPTYTLFGEVSMCVSHLAPQRVAGIEPIVLAQERSVCTLDKGTPSSTS